MFEWLTRMFGGTSASQTAAKNSVARGSLVKDSAAKSSLAKGSLTNGKPSAQGKPSGVTAKGSAVRVSEEAYGDLLAREVGEAVALDPADEQRVSELVEAVSGYLGTHKIDPPVMPAIASRMLELLRAEEVDVVALSRLIERDQATAAKLLTIANSAAFKGASEISGIRDAVVFLGTEQVAHIAIGLATRAMFESPKHQTRFAGPARWTRLFNHAMTVAFAACQVASRRTKRHSEAAFVGGLFHDVGKAVALRALTEVLAEKHQAAPSELVMDAVLQQLHSEPTAALYQTWTLPRQVMVMCQNHHHIAVDATPELHIVRLVSGLDTLRVGSPIEKRDVLAEISESAAALKMNDPELRAIHTETKEFGDRVTKMFG